MKSKPSIQHISLRVVLIGVLALSVACENQLEEKESIRPVFYQKITTEKQSNPFSIPGIVRYDQASKLSFKVGGVITTLKAVVGHKVTRGTLLATVDGTDYNLNLAQARATNETAQANVLNAEVQLVNAKSNYLRTEQLYVKNHTALSDFEKAKAQFENAKGVLKATQSQLKAAEAGVQAAQNQLSYTRLLAPVAGTVSQIFVEENEMVSPGMPIVILASNDVFEVNANVPETWVSQLKIGQEVTITIGSLDGIFKGSLKEISPNAPSNTGYPVTIDFEEAVPDLKAGMSVKVQIPNLKSDESAPWMVVDVDAISKDANGFFVYTLSANNDGTYTAKLQNVDVGDLTNKGYVINKGLESNQLIATAGIRFLYDGKIVSLKEPDFK